MVAIASGHTLDRVAHAGQHRDALYERRAIVLASGTGKTGTAVPGDPSLRFGMTAWENTITIALRT